MTDGSFFSAAALTVVLVASAWGKLRQPWRFRQALATFRLIPDATVPALAVVVPLAELSLAGLQWVAPVQAVVGLALIGMLSAFTLLLLGSLVSGEQADCGCFGSAAPEKVSWFSVLRNVVLIGLAVMGLVAGDGAARGALPAALAGVGAGMLILVLDQGVPLVTKTWAPDRFRT